MKFLVSLSLALLAASPLLAETIAEKKARLENKQERVGVASGDLKAIQKELNAQKEKVKLLQKNAYEYYRKEGKIPDVEELQKEKACLKEIEELFRKSAAQGEENEVALWHQPDTSVSDLIIDYASSEYIYLIPPEIAAHPLSLSSNLVVPKASWDTLLVQVLNESGVGVRTLSPFLRELYFLSEERVQIAALLTRSEELSMFAPHEHVGYLFSTAKMNPSTFRLLQRLANAKAIRSEVIEGQVVLFGAVQEIEQVLNVVKQCQGSFEGQAYKVVPLRISDSAEMVKVLDTLFSTKKGGDLPASGNKRTGTQGPAIESLLTVIPMKEGLFLLGSERTVQEAELTVQKIEASLKQKEEKIIFTYKCRHTNTEELAAILERVYLLMERTGAGFAEEKRDSQTTHATVNVQRVDLEDNKPLNPGFYQSGYYQEGEYVVNPRVTPPGEGVAPIGDNGVKGNFIVDPKTSTIVMVVEPSALPKLKELVHKLDVPKKMVQIEALLFEKRVDKETTFGLNLLSVGSKASQSRETALTFNDKIYKGLIEGITQFCLSRPKTSWIPAYDIAYKFLLSRDDVQINSNPSVVTVNQTEALIEINEEISINTGVYEFETNSGVIVPKDSFTRARYGTTIRVVPTIHEPDESDCWQFGEEGKFITLDTAIDFQTIHPGESRERPDVMTRHIKNIVRIPDGQTVIMGGLRRKNSLDKVDKIPFIGELPGIGKLFSMTSLKDQSTEMFIFLTPKIISDPFEDFQRQRMIEMTRRPGDIPGFMKRLVRAREREKHCLMEGSLEMLFGRNSERFYYTSEMLDASE